MTDYVLVFGHFQYQIKLAYFKKKTSSQPLSAFVGPSLLVRYLHTMKQATD